MHAKMLTQVTVIVVAGLCALNAKAAPVRLMPPEQAFASH
jgi:hypothetical protein